MRTHALRLIHLRESISSPEPTDSSRKEVGPLIRLRLPVCGAAPDHCELVPARANLVTSQAYFFAYFFRSTRESRPTIIWTSRPRGISTGSCRFAPAPIMCSTRIRRSSTRTSSPAARQTPTVRMICSAANCSWRSRRNSKRTQQPIILRAAVLGRLFLCAHRRPFYFFVAPVESSYFACCRPIFSASANSACSSGRTFAPC